MSITTMKSTFRPFLATALCGLLLAFTACETNFANPNNPTDEQVLNSREGLISLSIGVKNLYSTSGLRWLIETPAITTREAAITTTFQNMIELEDGGAGLPNFNSNVAGMWATLLRVINSSNDLINSADAIDLADDTRSSIKANAGLFKAMAIGGLALHFEQVIVETDLSNEANFVSRQEGFAAAIAALEAARTEISGGGVTDEFQATVLQGLDLANTIDAMLARFNLYAGNYEAAIQAADRVDLSVASVFQYDLMNANPIWSRVILNGVANFKPRDNFGLPESFPIDTADGRFDFYLVQADTLFNQNGLPIDDLAGFFGQATTPIPVYTPDEMRLISAEAEVRGNNDTETAIALINEVRTDDDDIFGVNAALEEYTGEASADEVLEEIYFQRRLELFLSGQSLEDSRRFGRPQPSAEARVFTDERNRNFYPYPERERNNNPNTPPDPSI